MSVVFWLVLWGFFAGVSSRDFFAGFLRGISSRDFFAGVSSQECLHRVSSRGAGVSRSRMNEPKFHMTWRRLTNPCVRAPPHEAKKSQKSSFNPGRSEPKNQIWGLRSCGSQTDRRNPEYGTRHGPTHDPKNSTRIRRGPH